MGITGRLGWSTITEILRYELTSTQQQERVVSFVYTGTFLSQNSCVDKKGYIFCVVQNVIFACVNAPHIFCFTYTDPSSEWKSWHVSFSPHTWRRGKCVKKCPFTLANFQRSRNCAIKMCQCNRSTRKRAAYKNYISRHTPYGNVIARNIDN